MFLVKIADRDFQAGEQVAFGKWLDDIPGWLGQFCIVQGLVIRMGGDVQEWNMMLVPD